MDILIKDIRPGMKYLNLTVIVLEVGDPNIVNGREVRTLKVADSSACINLCLWDEPGRLLIPGDIIRLTKSHANLFRKCLTLYAGKYGDLQKLGDFCMVFDEQLNMSEPNLKFDTAPGLMPSTSNNGNKGNPGRSRQQGGKDNNEPKQS